MPLRNYTTNSKQVKIKGLPISTDNEMQRQLMSTGTRQPIDVVPKFSLERCFSLASANQMTRIMKCMMWKEGDKEGEGWTGKCLSNIRETRRSSRVKLKQMLTIRWVSSYICSRGWNPEQSSKGWDDLEKNRLLFWLVAKITLAPALSVWAHGSPQSQWFIDIGDVNCETLQTIIRGAPCSPKCERGRSHEKKLHISSLYYFLQQVICCRLEIFLKLSMLNFFKLISPLHKKLNISSSRNLPRV